MAAYHLESAGVCPILQGYQCYSKAVVASLERFIEQKLFRSRMSDSRCKIKTKVNFVKVALFVILDTPAISTKVSLLSS